MQRAGEEVQRDQGLQHGRRPEAGRTRCDRAECRGRCGHTVGWQRNIGTRSGSCQRDKEFGYYFKYNKERQCSVGRCWSQKACTSVSPSISWGQHKHLSCIALWWEVNELKLWSGTPSLAWKLSGYSVRCWNQLLRADFMRLFSAHTSLVAWFEIGHGGIFTPQELADARNQGSSPPLEWLYSSAFSSTPLVISYYY